jgi:hypothetical protein
MRSTSKLWWWSLVVSLGALSACRSQVLDPFTTATNVAEQPVGPSGGRVEVSSGASVNIPAGAVTATTMIGVASAPSDGMPTLSPRVAPVGSIVALTPHGASFAAPVTVHIPFDPLRGAGHDLRLYTALPGGAFTAVDGARVGTDAVEADVRHFSYFVVGYETGAQTFPERQGRKLDLLFMVDNSLSMLPLQQKLLANFPVFMQTLRALPGGLPDLHIGVVSSDMGANGYDIQQCNNDRGVLQATPRGAVACSGPTGNFISTGPNESAPNYSGTIEDTFTCIAALGQNGCGYEQQLESVAVALGARGQIPAENAGFLRPDALLGIVLLTNEDDCSVPPGSNLFSTDSRLLSDPLGPLASYRCNEFGHMCAGGVRPPRQLPAGGGPVTLTDCHSAEDGRLNRIADYAQLYQGLKDDPSQVFLAVVTGPPTPYVVEWQSALIPNDVVWPQIEHSCMETSGEYADPAVRLADLVGLLGGTATSLPICAPSFAPALSTIGAAVTAGLGPRCLQASSVDPATLGLNSMCKVYDSVPSGGGFRAETELAACESGAPAGASCYTLTPNMLCADSLVEIGVARDPMSPAPEGAILVVRCGGMI